MSDSSNDSIFRLRDGSYYLPATETLPLYHTLEMNLKQQGITEGLVEPDFWEFQKQGIKYGLNELVAASRPEVCSIKLKKWPWIKTLNDFFQLSRIHSPYGKIRENKPYTGEDIIPPTIFVRQNEEFLIVNDMGEGLPVNFKWDKFTVHRTDNKKNWVFKAVKTGYMSFYNNSLSIIPPNWIYKENIRIYYRFLPVIHDIDDIFNHYFKLFSDHKMKYPKSRTDSIEDKDLLKSFISEDRYKEIILCDGDEPIQGVDSKISILIKEDKPETEGNNAIDYHAWNRYKTVVQEEAVAELIPAIPGKDGFDIFGKSVKVNKGKDIPIKVGQNILVENLSGKTVYKALTSGLFNFNGKEISVSELFIINGDVNFNTGNVDYDKTVQIKGNVTSGFSVKSREQIIVEGVIEDGCQIECQGNLEVVKGIIGEKTKVSCYGELMAGYIQDAVIYSKGNITVARNITRGHIFTEASLRVLGNKVKGKSSGSVLGGSYYAIENIEVHSAGSLKTKTLLSLGYNPYTLLTLDEINTNIALIDRKLSISMSSLPADIQTENGKKRLQLLTRKEKQILKEKLLTLKKLSLKKDELEDKIEKEKERQFVPHPEKLKLTINTAIIGDISIRIGSIKAVFEPRPGKSEFSYNPEINSIEIK